MQTTEIFIEQVLIGAMVLLIGALPFYDTWGHYVFDRGDNNPLLVYAAAFVAAAYLLGIPFDRFIDARMANYERHIRARYALKAQEAKDRRTEANVKDPDDPFPEDQLRIEMIRATDIGGTHFNYLRSTMRLSRALAVCVPGLAVAGIVAVSGSPAYATDWRALALLAACYFVPPALGKLADWGELTKKSEKKTTNLLAFVDNHHAPRTDKAVELVAFGKRPGFDVKSKGPQWVTLCDVGCSSLTWTHVALLALAVCLARDQQLAIDKQPVVVAMAIAGIGLTALNGWAWWRIVTTYMTYLSLLHRFGADQTHGFPATAGGGSR